MTSEGWTDYLIHKNRRKLIKLPPSAKFILYLMYERSMVDRKYLASQTLLSNRTIGHSLKILLKQGLIEKIKVSELDNDIDIDKRVVKYRLSNNGDY